MQPGRRAREAKRSHSPRERPRPPPGGTHTPPHRGKHTQHAGTSCYVPAVIFLVPPMLGPTATRFPVPSFHSVGVSCMLSSLPGPTGVSYPVSLTKTSREQHTVAQVPFFLSSYPSTPAWYFPGPSSSLVGITLLTCGRRSGGLPYSYMGV